MKKTTIYAHRLIEYFSKFIQTDKKDINQNKQEIMNSLFYSNFIKLDVSESIDLKLAIDSKFDNEIDQYHEKILADLKSIELYKSSKQKKLIEKIVDLNDPIFDKKVTELEFIKK